MSDQTSPEGRTSRQPAEGGEDTAGTSAVDEAIEEQLQQQAEEGAAQGGAGRVE